MLRRDPQAGPILRLVGDEADTAPPRPPASGPRSRPGPARPTLPQPDHAARRAVARENQLAATVSPHDARWIFAVDTAASLEGGRAALLPAKSRQRLLARATSLGLRPFDANLVIAVVQDAQRDGRALSRQTQERLLLVRPADPVQDAAGTRFVVALILAAVFIQAWAVWFFNH